MALVLSWAVRTHPVVGGLFRPRPVNVATPPDAETVVVPERTQLPVVTLSVMESVEDGEVVTVTVGLN